MRNSVTCFRARGEGLYSDAVVRFSKLDTNNWKPLLAFRRRLIAGEVAPEPGTASVAPTSEASETTAARGIRKTACRPISAAKKQQILDLEPTGMSARVIARQVGTSTSTVKAVCRQAKQPPPPQAPLHGRRPPACSAAPRPGTHLHRDRPGARLRAGHGQEASGSDRKVNFIRNKGTPPTLKASGVGCDLHLSRLNLSNTNVSWCRQQ